MKNNIVPLYDAMLMLKESAEIQQFLEALCTPSELQAFHERWTVAQLLDKGTLSYQKIHDQTGVSTTTITRVARYLKQKDYPGYRKLLTKIKGKNK